MTVVYDYYIVAIDSKYESGKSKSGIILLNEAHMEEWAESHNKYRRTYGTILRAPLAFSDTVIDLRISGMPEPRVFVSGEYIELMQRVGHRYAPTYTPSTFDGYPTVTLADVASRVDAKQGDKLYFDYLVTDQENFLGKYGDKEMYLCRVDRIYCVVRQGQIIPQGSWCLVKPDMETWESITLPSGLITKTAPGATWTRETDKEGRPAGWKMEIAGIPLQGFVSYISQRDDLKVGDHVLFQRDADCLIKVEGTQYYVMKESDVLCKI